MEADILIDWNTVIPALYIVQKERFIAITVEIVFIDLIIIASGLAHASGAETTSSSSYS